MTSPAPSSESPALYRLAVIAIGGSSVINSVGGLVVRSTEAASEWQIIMMRAASLSVALLCVFAWQRRGRVISGIWEAGRWAALGALMVATANVGIIHSFQNTTVANTLFVLSAVPLVTAILARIFLGERVARATWIAMSVALVGIGLMVGDGMAAGTLFGNAMALMTMFAFATFMVILRRGRAANMLPATIFGALLSSSFSATVSGFDFDITTRDLVLCVAWGAGISCLVHALFTFGSRHVKGAEMALLSLLEFVIGPIWVWLVVDEVPTRMTIIGGIIVLGAVSGRALALARKN